MGFFQGFKEFKGKVLLSYVQCTENSEILALMPSSQTIQLTHRTVRQSKYIRANITVKQ